jgi:hypothetical protein
MAVAFVFTKTWFANAAPHSAKARSSLRRLIERLLAAIKITTRLFHGDSKQPLDYKSLASISATSKQDAIGTMSLLSSRLSHSGRRRGASPSSKAASVRRRKSKSDRRSHSTCITLHSHGRNSMRSIVTRGTRNRQSAAAWSESSDSTKIGEVRRPRRDRDKDAYHKVSYAYFPEFYSHKAPRRSWWNPFSRRKV